MADSYPWQQGCFQWFKDTNLKANHNCSPHVQIAGMVVSNGSKILIWKQITTLWLQINFITRCFQWFKDTNLKANHNMKVKILMRKLVVSNGSKILIWKQITTDQSKEYQELSCFQWFKDTNLKANHNNPAQEHLLDSVVSNGSKILIWKQITTAKTQSATPYGLFPMVQRY